jgi:hypothetical protein
LVRSEVKAAVREGAKTVSKDLVTAGTESAAKSLIRHQSGAALAQGAAQTGSTVSKQLARWWSVRSAGGLFQVLKRFPDALPRLSIAQLTEMAGPLASKAGLRLSRWHAVRLMKDGAEVVLRIPPQRGLKYVAAQAVQAGVGVVGIQKMEEYMKSRRTSPTQEKQTTIRSDL